MIEESKEIHRHCKTCYSFTRCTREGDACEFVPCRMSCSQIYHGCKEAEHLEGICPNVRVPCINSVYGCQTHLRRKEMNNHLGVCPASVVICTAGWERWPVYSFSRSGKMKPQFVNPLPTSGQLDYELAMRDQAVIDEAGIRARKARVSEPLKFLRQKSSLVKSENKPFIPEQSPFWEKELARRLKGKQLPKKYWEYPELEKGNVHQNHCSKCFSLDCSGNEKDFCPIVSCKWGCESKLHICKITEHSIVCPKAEDECNYRGMSREIERIKFFEPQPPKIELHESSRNYLFKNCNEIAHIKGINKRGYLIPDPPPIPAAPDFWKSCRFDIRYSTANCKRSVKKGSYSMRCHELLRRDQFLWHYRNVHNEIISDISSWIESRCPMFGYGCNFSVRRLFPAQKNKSLAFNRFTGTFELANEKSTVLASESGEGLFWLESLPAEILLFIFSYLDSCSLNSVTKVSDYLGEICNSLLSNSGCVSPVWKRRDDIKGSAKWEIHSFQWFYSTSFQPIKSWRVENLGGVSNHLKECPYYVPTRHIKPEVLNQLTRDGWSAIFSKIKKS